MRKPAKVNMDGMRESEVLERFASRRTKILAENHHNPWQFTHIAGFGPIIRLDAAESPDKEIPDRSRKPFGQLAFPFQHLLEGVSDDGLQPRGGHPRHVPVEIQVPSQHPGAAGLELPV